MRTILCHVEEPSMEAFLRGILPRLIADRAEWKIINHGSKDRLLKNLPTRLQSYRGTAGIMDLGVLILIDRDDDDCKRLKNDLEQMALSRGLATKTSPTRDGLFHVVNRIVIEELEAWFFGDVAAMRETYPRIPETLGESRNYRNPDAIRGGTWEALHREMKGAGYFKDNFPKIEVARAISPFMNPEANRSPSFQAFRQGLEALISPRVIGKTTL